MPVSWRNTASPTTGLSGSSGRPEARATNSLKRAELARVHATILLQGQPRRHDHFFQRSVAGAFAQAVDRDARAIRAGSERGNGVGRGHAEVVVPVKFQAQLRHGCAQGADEIAGLQRVQNADGVRDAQTAQARPPARPARIRSRTSRSAREASCAPTERNWNVPRNSAASSAMVRKTQSRSFFQARR